MTPLIIYFITLYFIGYALTLTILIKWGKRMGFDYSGERTYANYDDWPNNKTAYTGISFTSWLFILGLIVAGIWKGLNLITGKFVKD